MGTAHLNLKWENYMFNMASYFQDFLSSKIFVDVTLVCEGQKLGAHKIILSACSQFLKNVFIENPCKHPIIVISDISLENLNAILKYVYTGEVDVPYENLPSLLKASKSLCIIGLNEILKDHQDKHRYQKKFPYKKLKKRTYQERSSHSSSSDDESSSSYKKRQSPTDNILNLSFPSKKTTGNPSTSGIHSLHTLLQTQREEPNYIPSSSTVPQISTLLNKKQTTSDSSNALNLTYQSKNAPDSCLNDNTQMGLESNQKDDATSFTSVLKVEQSSFIENKNDDSSNSRLRPNSCHSELQLDVSETSNDGDSSEEVDANRKLDEENYNALKEDQENASNENNPNNSLQQGVAHQHKAQDKPESEHMYKCNMCTKTYPKQMNLNWHYQRAHSTKEFRCDICNKSFKTRDLVTQHMRVHMPNSFTCKYCGLSFRWRSTLKKHSIKQHNQSHEQEMEP